MLISADGTFQLGPTIEKLYDARITATVDLPGTNSSDRHLLVVLEAKITKLVGFLLDNELIEFDTGLWRGVPWVRASGVSWVREWGLLSTDQVFAIGDGSPESLGLYSLKGAPAKIQFVSPVGTPETVYRIERRYLRPVDGNPFLLNPQIGSIYSDAAYGPE